MNDETNKTANLTRKIASGRERLLRAKARKLERENRVAERALVPMDDVELWISKNYLIPMASIFADMPAAIDTRCNPTDPAMARRAIEAYIEGTVKPALRASLEKPKTKEGSK